MRHVVENILGANLLSGRDVMRNLVHCTLSQSEKREHSRCSQPGILHTDYTHVGESAYPDQGEARRHHQNQRLVQRTTIAEQGSSMNHSGESAQSSRIHKKDVCLVRYCTRRR